MFPMEIKELIPKSKELIIRPQDSSVFCETFCYEIHNSYSTNGANGKKYLYIVSQTQSEDSSSDYIPNLIASFIKREVENNFRSDSESNWEEPVEKSLKKANELIESLLKENNELKLDLGVAYIDKEKVAISKIGKAKLLTYRTKTGDVFDVFDNAQAAKSAGGGKRFSNLISGEIKKDDRFFFFIPNTKLNFKQKLISANLSKNNQNTFSENVKKIITAPAFLAGIHFEIKEELKKVAREPEHKKNEPLPNQIKEMPIVATEVAKISRSDKLKATTEKFKEMVMGNPENSNRGWRLIKPRGASNYLIVAIIGLAIVGGLVLFSRSNSKFKEALALVNEKIRAGESKLLLKQSYEARKSLAEATSQLNSLEDNKDKEKAQLAALSLLNKIEKINTSAEPTELLSEQFNGNLAGMKNILAANSRIFLNDNEKLYLVKENGASPLPESSNIILSWIKENKFAVYGNNIKVIDLETNKVIEIKKKFNFEPVEFKNYEDNLYFIGQKNIYKITNALVSPTGELEWLKSGEAQKIRGNLVSFDLDSTIYALTDQRKLVILFKGEVSKTINLDFDVKSGTEIVKLGEKELMVIDKESKLARVINDSGELVRSYNLSKIDQIKDSFFDKSSRTLYLLSPSQIWSLKI
ncbi:MAG: hypothetical protein AAB469_02015 [Patescibacteria group bacterium]